MPQRSINFAFLKQYEKLETIAGNAERDWNRNPVGALIQTRLFAELLVAQVSIKLRFHTSSLYNFTDVIARIESAGVPRDPIDLLHELRRKGNDAAHRGTGTPKEALDALERAHRVAIWFQRSFHDSQFKPTAFIQPSDAGPSIEALKQRVAALEAEALKHRGDAAAAKSEAAAATARAEQEAFDRQVAEERAQRARDEKKIWEELAAENEKLAQESAKQAASRSGAKAKDPAEIIREFVENAKAAARAIHRTEADVRRDIDEQLRLAGWEADTELLTFALGARPEHGTNRAIAEWPTDAGPADYVLFIGLRAVGVVEAKRDTIDVAGAIEQAKRYSGKFAMHHDAERAGGPWGKYAVPFLFSTNGRAYVRQLETKSGIWMLDARTATNHPAALQAWPTPEGLDRKLREDIPKAHDELKKTPIAALRLRPYQNDAILAVERALEKRQSAIMLAMATGTGKTRTAIGLIYRLIESGRFHRILFVVDRSALGEQAENAFKDVKVANEKTFAQIFGIKGLEDTSVDRDTRLHIATVQGLMHRILRDDAPPAIDDYDCIIVDECHRGYTLDREMTEAEVLYGDADDFVSKYRRVLDYFSAVKIGLTATPALHTSKIFGDPVFFYSYSQAVVDKVLVPQEPERIIETFKSKNGIKYKVGETVAVYKRQTAFEYARLEDDVAFDVESFNRSIITPGFDRAVCEALADEIALELNDKTLVFCVDDAHADRVVGELKRAMELRHGPIDDDTIQKITGRADRPLERIRRFRNEKLPKIVVTVDLLTTGIDVPAISNLVFMRQVKSRILYEQMKGRATRLCPEIDKESFRVYDAVKQCDIMREWSDMQATAVQPTHTFVDLFKRLAAASEPAHQEAVLEQIVTRLRRKRKLIEEKMADAFEAYAGGSVRETIEAIAAMDPSEAAAWMVQRPALFGLLDGAKGEGRRVILDEGSDTFLGMRENFGGKKPEDYLEAFAAFVKTNLNRLPALQVIATRPRDLTRRELREVADTLAQNGYDEIRLRKAYGHVKNVDIAASILGYIRQQAVGDPLVDYDKRVEIAVDKVLRSRPWTGVQKQWLQRLGKQMKQTLVVDRAALDDDPFRDAGGFARLDQVFDGKAEDVLSELKEAVWGAVG